MKKFFVCLLVFGGLTFAASAQNICGNSAESQALYTERLLNNLQAVEAGEVLEERNAIRYVPIHFHLVGNTDGSGRAKEAAVLDQLCNLNKQYAPLEIQFYLSPHPVYGMFNKNINNVNVYSNQSNTTLMQNNRHPNAINVFVVDNPTTNSNQPGVIIGYYNTPRDWIVMGRDYINGSTTNGNLAHELGHFFSLRHTFYGYEVNPFDGTDDPTWPVAPALAPDLGASTERVNGTNCSTAADLICDTPPDYNFGFFSAGCSYTGQAKDPLNAAVNPMEENFMSYFNNCSYKFTPTQMSIIASDLLQDDRAYLNNNFVPAAGSISTPTSLLNAPASGAVTTNFNAVTLEWKAVAGATHYLVDIDVNISYTSADTKTFVTDKTALLLPALKPNQTYYWRVQPFNQLVGCAATRSRFFTTPQTSAVREIEGLSAMTLSPNPVDGNQAVRLAVRSDRDFEATVSVFDYTGRRVWESTNVQFNSGDTYVDLPAGNFANGLYFVSLDTAKGRSVRKLAVSK